MKKFLVSIISAFMCLTTAVSPVFAEENGETTVSDQPEEILADTDETTEEILEESGSDDDSDERVSEAEEATNADDNEDIDDSVELTVDAPLEEEGQTADSGETVEPTGIILSETDVTMIWRTTKTLTATVVPSNATNKEIVWYSGNESIATVDQNGTITATGLGYVTIFATIKGTDIKVSCAVAVRTFIEMSKFALDKTELNLVIGQSEILYAKPYPTNADDAEFDWISSDPSVATVDQDGTVKALRAGTAIITASVVTRPYIKRQCTVTVSGPVINATGIALNKTETSMTVGQSETLNATVAPADATNNEVTWSSDDPSVATVDQDGTVKALKAGTAIITATVKDTDIKAQCTIAVEKSNINASGITLDKSEANLLIGQSEILNATVVPDNADNKEVAWSSDNPAVATVDQDGTVKALKAGTAIITATVKDTNITAQCTITVKKAVVKATGINLDRTEARMTVGQDDVLKATVIPDDADNKEVVWTTSNPSVATVDQNGNVQALKTGTAVITATVEGTDLKAQCIVTVKKAEISPSPVVDITDIHIDGLEDSYPYTGSAVKPEFLVYDGEKLLAENTDYTVTYKNNTKAGEASAIIKGKGSYTSQKEVTFDITAVSMDEVFAEEITTVHTGKALKISPKVSWNGKSLKSGTDYTIDYNGWDQVSEGEHTIILEGKGNYTGTKEVSVHVAPKTSEVTPVSKLKVSAKAVNYTNGLNVDKVIELSGFTVKDGKNTIDSYTISDDYGCEEAGTCTFTLTGTDPYYGARTVSIKVNGTPISKAKASKSAVYDGTPKTLMNSGIDLVVGDTTLSSDEYDVLESTYENNINAGKASVLVRGLKGYTGTAKITFMILPDTSTKTVTVGDTDYSKGGSVPAIIVDGLREGTDYKVTYKNNKKTGTGTATVSFLGNYKGTAPVTKTFSISTKDIDDVYVTAKDVAWKNKKGNYKSKISVVDTDGKKLGSSDYTIVSYKDQNGTVLDKNAIANSGDVITAEIQGKGNYTGTTYVTYRVTGKVLDLSKAKITLVKEKEYTGSAIEIDPAKDILSATIPNGTLKYGENYEILYYENNVKKGTAKVTFIGMDDCSGTKTVTFRISQKNVSKHWYEALAEALGLDF